MMTMRKALCPRSQVRREGRTGGRQRQRCPVTVTQGAPDVLTWNDLPFTSPSAKEKTRFQPSWHNLPSAYLPPVLICLATEMEKQDLEDPVQGQRPSSTINWLNVLRCCQVHQVSISSCMCVLSHSVVSSSATPWT